MGRIKKKNVTRPMPTEFLIPNIYLQTNSTPSTYFLHFRFEIISQQVLFWLFRKTGVFFFLSQFKYREHFFLLQFLFYKTYFTKKLKKRVPKLVYQRLAERLSQKKKKLNNPVLLARLGARLTVFFENKVKIKKGVKGFQKNFFWKQKYKNQLESKSVAVSQKVSWQTVKSAKNGRKQQKAARLLKAQQYARFKKKLKKKAKRYFKKTKRVRRWFKLRLKKSTNKVRVTPLKAYHFFLTYFLYFWFQQPAVILSKSLFKLLQHNVLFKQEMQFLTRKCFYLFKKAWTYDLVFLLNGALTLYNFTLFTPFFIMHILFKRHKIMFYLKNFIKFLDKFFYLKQNILGIRFLLLGPYRSKRRSIMSYQKGVFDYNCYISRLLYDTIICPTTYGVSSFKIWIYYSTPLDKI